MQRYSFSLLGTLVGLAAISMSSPVGAQQERSTVNALPPSTCYAHPADLLPLGPGDYPWDAPPCAAARAKWEKAHTNAVVATEIAPPSSSTLALSNRPSTPTQKVD